MAGTLSAEDGCRDGGDVADQPGFDDFVVARSPTLLRTAYLLTGDWALAEDLLQTALTKCWRRWDRITEGHEPYVHRTLVTTYLSWRGRRWNGELATAELPERAVGDHATHVDERAALWVALRRLPPRQRAVIVLRYFEDLTEAETARLLNVHVGTVKSQTSKALVALRLDPELRPDDAPTLDEVR